MIAQECLVEFMRIFPDSTLVEECFVGDGQASNTGKTIQLLFSKFIWPTVTEYVNSLV